MKFKKILVLLLAIAMMSMPLAACGSPAAEAPIVETPVAESTVVADAAMAYFANYPSDKHMIEKISDFFLKVDAGEEMLILDIRSAEDYALGHLKGAVNLPFASTAIADNLQFIPDDIPVYVNCYTGQTASQVTSILNAAGKNVINLKGGWIRGISTTPGYEAYTDTVAATMPTTSYTTDPELATAIVDYFNTVVSYKDTPFANQNVAPEFVKELVDSNSDEYTILSVRKAEDFALGHIPTAINIPFGAGMEIALAQLPMDKPIIVYCYTGHTASQTVGILRLLGYEAYNMSFGMGSVETEKGWLGAGFTTVVE